MPRPLTQVLEELETLRGDYGRDLGGRRLRLLRRLEAASLSRARDVLRLHELLCFLRAYPDDRRVLAQAEQMLAAFAHRPDLRRHRPELADSGIAGTDLHYRFYWITARWLARRWPDRLSVDWREFGHRDRLLEILDLLLPYAETPGLDLVELSARDWVRRLKAADETDATFLIRRFEALDAAPAVRERLYEGLDLPLRLAPGPATPARTSAYHERSPVVPQRRALDRRRPRLRRELDRRPGEVRSLSPREGRRLVDLAREAMVTRHRDLDAFAYADPRDARMVAFAGGLRFACLGARPERRLLLEARYGLLTLKNGVPIGYALASALFRSAEVAYNVFDTFRGAEAATVFARLLAAVRHLFGADAFAIDPYQLGYGNAEGLASGAWWFYYKLGFRPHDREVRRVLRGELQRMAEDPAHRSSIPTLEKLAADYLFFYRDRPRREVLGRIDLGSVGLAISRYLADRFGADRERAVRVCSAEAMRRFGLASLSGFSRDERLAWERWAPLLLILPGAEAWSPGERRALVRVVRAKGGRCESEFVRRFDRHPRLGKALLELARG